MKIVELDPRFSEPHKHYQACCARSNAFRMDRHSCFDVVLHRPVDILCMSIMSEAIIVCAPGSAVVFCLSHPAALARLQESNPCCPKPATLNPKPLNPLNRETPNLKALNPGPATAALMFGSTPTCSASLCKKQLNSKGRGCSRSQHAEA